MEGIIGHPCAVPHQPRVPLMARASHCTDENSLEQQTHFSISKAPAQKPAASSGLSCRRHDVFQDGVEEPASGKPPRSEVCPRHGRAFFVPLRPPTTTTRPPSSCLQNPGVPRPVSLECYPSPPTSETLIYSLTHSPSIFWKPRLHACAPPPRRGASWGAGWVFCSPWCLLGTQHVGREQYMFSEGREGGTFL